MDRWKAGVQTYPEAACKPRPRDPPVTTTTLPLREKILGKSCSSVSYLMVDMTGSFGKLKSKEVWRI